MSHVPALSSNGHAASALVRLRNKMFFDTEYFDGSFALLNPPKGVGPYFVTIHSTLHFLSSGVPSHQCQRHGVVASEPTMKGEKDGKWNEPLQSMDSRFPPMSRPSWPWTWTRWVSLFFADFASVSVALLVSIPFASPLYWDMLVCQHMFPLFFLFLFF